MSAVEIKPLKWESENFGYPCAEMIISSGLFDEKDLKTLQYSLIVIRAKSPLERLTPMLVDEKVTFAKEISDVAPPSSVGENINFKKVTPKLLELAFEAGKDSRFYKDKNFKSGEFQILYNKWIENSLNGKIADEVYVSGTYSEPTGLVTLKRYQDKATIGLIAVSPQSQGKGIGQKLVNWCEYDCFRHNILNLQVSTQRSNTLACKFYQKCGFQTFTNEYIYHWWNK